MNTHDALRLLGCVALSAGIGLLSAPLHANGPHQRQQARGNRARAPGTRGLARRAVDADAAVAGNARSALRAIGPAGLDAMMSVHSREIDHLRRDPRVARDPEITRVREALDAVARAR